MKGAMSTNVELAKRMVLSAGFYIDPLATEQLYRT